MVVGLDLLVNDWLKSYLFERRQFVFINEFNSNNALLKYGVLRGSVLRPKLNRLVNLDMKHLFVWLDVAKSELVGFKQMNRKRLYPTASVEYLGLKMYKNLNWHHHINDLAVKLNRANTLLFKIRNYVNQTY